MICILKNTLLVIIVCSVVGFVSIAHAAEGSNAEKQQLFEKLMQVTDMQARYVQMIDIVVNQAKLGLQTVMQQMAQKIEKATPEQKKKFAQIMEDMMATVAARMIVAIKKEMPFSELAERVYYPLYDKYFSTSELQSILEFYESPSGKKFVSTAPIILQESVSLVNQLYLQRLQELGQTVAAEEVKRIAPELEKIAKD